MERRSIKTLLSQGTAGGVCGTYLLLCVMVLSDPDVYHYVPAVALPIYLLFGAGIGTAAGAAIWALEGGVGRNWRILSRVAISTLFKVPLFVLLSYFQKFDQKTLFYRYTAVILFGLAILLLTSSNIRPWRLIAHGTTEPLRQKILFNRDPVRITRTIEESRDTFLAGLPLRAVSLFALMVSAFSAIAGLPFFLREGWSYVGLPELTEFLALTAYYGATVCVSFALRSKWLVLVMAMVVNVPWAVWMLPDGPASNPFRAMIVVYFFFAFWLLFLTGILVSSAKKGKLQVECGHTEIRFGQRQWVKESQ